VRCTPKPSPRKRPVPSSPDSQSYALIDLANEVLLLTHCQFGLSVAAESRPHQKLVDNVTTVVRTVGFDATGSPGAVNSDCLADVQRHLQEVDEWVEDIERNGIEISFPSLTVALRSEVHDE
jgi:hypothetical protein